MPDTLHVFTSAAVNYLPKVRVLCESIKKHHPEAVVHLALADERPAWLDPAKEPFDDVMPIDTLGIPDWRRWAFTHDIVELSTAIKPFALARLLERPDCGAVLYFDPDMVLFSRVDDILGTLAHSNVALTPHQVKPEATRDAIIDNEICSLKVGVFNLGFIGVRNTPEGRAFAAWWGERCYDFCRAEIHNGLFTDQKWINFAPIFFEGVAILKSARHNVATWNLTTRRFEGNATDGFTVDGEPLGFYHFTGFDSGAHRIMANKNAPGNDAVQALVGWYERTTAPSSGDPVAATPWAFGRFSDGTKIERPHRWIYRQREDLRNAFPDPFDAAGPKHTFLEWCRTEGPLRYPELFSARPVAPATERPWRLSMPVAVRMALLMLSPRDGKPLRQRFARVWHDEGVAGIARRLRRTIQPAP